ncbi:MAG TPA: alpha/beta family hydrolase [Acidimicrobiales bacterium]
MAARRTTPKDRPLPAAPADRVGALLLTPGAGSDRHQPALVAIEQAVAPLPVERIDFPYRIAGRKAPDRPPVLLATIRAAAAELVARAGIAEDQLVLGGRSMGGRMCSVAVADGLPAAALVLISYPLHQPGRPEKLRIEHLPALDVPCLFISGMRDPFGSPEELTAATAAIPGPVTHEWIERGRHDLRGSEPTVAAMVATWLSSLA